MNRSRYIFLSLASLIVSLIVACSSIECPIENTVATVYKLEKATGAADTLSDTLTIFSVRADGRDTFLLYNRGARISSFTLPVSSNAAADTLYFLRWDSVYEALDTVIIRKRDIPHFESVDCSASFFHELVGVTSTHNGIDTIIINKSSVDYDLSTEHFHMRFKAHP